MNKLQTLLIGSTLLLGLTLSACGSATSEVPEQDSLSYTVEDALDELCELGTYSPYEVSYPGVYSMGGCAATNGEGRIIMYRFGSEFEARNFLERNRGMAESVSFSSLDNGDWIAFTGDKEGLEPLTQWGFTIEQVQDPW